MITIFSSPEIFNSSNFGTVCFDRTDGMYQFWTRNVFMQA